MESFLLLFQTSLLQRLLQCSIIIIMTLTTVCYNVTFRQLTWHGDIFYDIQNSFSDVGLSVVMICSLPITKHLQKYWNGSKADSLWSTTLCNGIKKFCWLFRRANSCPLFKKYLTVQCTVTVSCIILIVNNTLWCQN